MNKILVVGDSCTDVFIYGMIERVSPEAPVPVIKPLKKAKNSGMAGNVVENLKKLNVDVDLITNKKNINKIRYVDYRYNQMVLRVDENDECERIDVNLLDLEKIENEYDAVIFSDYNKGFLTEEDIKFISNIKCLTFLDTKKFLGEWCEHIDFIKINHQEHQKNFEKIPKYPMLKNKLIITKGADGCVYNGEIYPAEKVQVRDVSGAGDTFMAGLVTKYIKTKDIQKSINFAQKCTKKVVQKSGVATI